MRIAIASLLIPLAFPAFAQTADAPLGTRTDPEEGTYLVDGNGMSLYLFLADTQGGDGMEPRVTCEGECLAVWPPLVVEEAPVADDALNESLLGTIARSDGLLHVTYNGWPLYYYAEDAAPGDIKGHDIESFGEEWYLIGPDGNRAEGGGGHDDDDNGEDEDSSGSGSGSSSGSNSGPDGSGDNDDY
jgi:predicted lipoprotein with Yx(FWY)xxD motif